MKSENRVLETREWAFGVGFLQNYVGLPDLDTPSTNSLGLISLGLSPAHTRKPGCEIFGTAPSKTHATLHSMMNK